MPNEQQERQKRLEEVVIDFPDGKQIISLDWYVKKALLSFIDKEVALAVANKEKEIVEVYKERIEKYQNTTTLSISTANATQNSEGEDMTNLIEELHTED